MPYVAEISRSNPTCFVFLVDQSASMAKPFPGLPGKSKAHGVADVINRLLSELVKKCSKGYHVVDRYQFILIGYGDQAASIWQGALANQVRVPVSQLANHPLRVERRLRRVPDGSGGTVEESSNFPVWLEPAAQGKTCMCRAMDMAWEAVVNFVEEFPGCFPPMVINVTDGMATDGDPAQHATMIRDYASRDGNVLLFNVHISSHAAYPLLFPDREQGLPDDFARRLFQMSSLLPPRMAALAREDGFAVTDATRGFVFNADFDAIVRFLDIGTRVSAANLR
jgi:hypothetical protein